MNHWRSLSVPIPGSSGSDLHLMEQNSFSGPIICMIAPNVTIANMNAIRTVNVITNAKVSKNMKLAKYKKNPDMKVVMHPLRILTPISLYACLIFSDLVSCIECI